MPKKGPKINVSKARKMLGEKYSHMIDKEISELISQLRIFTSSLVEVINEELVSG